MCVKLKKTMLVGFMAGWMLWGGRPLRRRLRAEAGFSTVGTRVSELSYRGAGERVHGGQFAIFRRCLTN